MILLISVSEKKISGIVWFNINSLKPKNSCGTFEFLVTRGRTLSHWRRNEQWCNISPFYTVWWGRGCYFIKINRMRSKYFGGLIYVSLSRKRLRFIGNSQDSTLHNVTLYLWQLTDCPSYGYISNIFSVYVYV